LGYTRFLTSLVPNPFYPTGHHAPVFFFDSTVHPMSLGRNVKKKNPEFFFSTDDFSRSESELRCIVVRGVS